MLSCIITYAKDGKVLNTPVHEMTSHYNSCLATGEGIGVLMLCSGFGSRVKVLSHGCSGELDYWLKVANKNY